MKKFINKDYLETKKLLSLDYAKKIFVNLIVRSFMINVKKNSYLNLAPTAML
jgi:hypothetical protein